MKKRIPSPVTTRREFLAGGAKGAGLLALGSQVPSFALNSLCAADLSADTDGTVLVLVKLAGGNDGLNTLVPFNDDTYYEFRPNIAIKKNDALEIDENFGFHPAMAGFEGLFKDGKLAVVQDVGYPNSTRSHFSGQDYYERGGGYEFSGTGWLGRYLDIACPAEQQAASPDPNAVHISRHMPITLRTEHPQAVFSMLSSNMRTILARQVADDETAALLKQTVEAAAGDENPSVDLLNVSYMNAIVTEEKVRGVLESYRPEAKYPGGTLAADLRATAALISSGMASRIYCLETGGFDTHSNQLSRHQTLLENVSGAITAFVEDLEAKVPGDRVIVMPFSEFGRRPYENGSSGTDHGTNSVFFVAGSKVKGGLYGEHVSIPEAKRSDLRFTDSSLDFRQLYATVLDQWLGGDPAAVFGRDYEQLDFLGEAEA